MIAITKKHLSQGHRIRPGTKISYTTLTIHSTGNPTSTADSERRWLDNPSNNRDASWHYVIDEKDCIEAIPPTEIAWHAGSGNKTSIGIEICESGDREKTLDRAAEFVADLLKAKGWKTDKLKRHYDWTQKSCPRILMANNWAGWTDFKKRVESYLSGGAYMEPNYGKVTADSLNIRKTPNTSIAPIGKLTKGTDVKLLGASGNFWKIDKGYISKDYIDTYYVEEKETAGLKVQLDGHIKSVDGVIKDGRTYIQMREICEMIGCTIGFADGMPTIDTPK